MTPTHRFPKIGFSPKSAILMVCSSLSHPFVGIPILGTPPGPKCSLLPWRKLGERCLQELGRSGWRDLGIPHQVGAHAMLASEAGAFWLDSAAVANWR